MQGVVVWELSAVAEGEGSWVELVVADVELTADVDPKYVQSKGQVVEKADEGEAEKEAAAEAEKADWTCVDVPQPSPFLFAFA